MLSRALNMGVGGSGIYDGVFLSWSSRTLEEKESQGSYTARGYLPRGFARAALVIDESRITNAGTKSAVMTVGYESFYF